MRGLRKILARPTTFYDRTCTNQRVLEEATSIVYTAPGDQCKIQLFSEFHNNRRAKLMGDILRTNADDPLRQVSFLPDSAHRLDYGKKRVGKPRQNWLYHTKKHVHEHVLNRHLYSEIDDDHGNYTAAMQRLF
jgi:hypothetical protein